MTAAVPIARAARVFVLPSRLISQDEIEGLLSLDNDLRSLTKKRDALAGGILDRLMSGVSVEPGVYHPKALSRECAGGREWRLVIR